MSTLTLKIPEGILSAIRQSAEEAGVSVDQFVSSAAGEKLVHRFLNNCAFGTACAMT